MARRDDFTLTPEELLARKRQRRRRLIVAAIVVLLLVIGAFTARPIGGAIKAWQARRHAEKAFTFIEQEKWDEARDSAIAAYQLRPTEPKAIRAVARLLSRTGQQQAFEFWDQLATQEQLTPPDLRDQATVALASRQREKAAAAVQTLLASAPTAHDWLLAGQLRLQEDAPERALESARMVLANPAASRREQLQAASLQLQGARTPNIQTNQEAVEESWKRIAALSDGEDAVALDALVALAQRQLASGETNTAASSAAGTPPRGSRDELIRRLESHPLAEAPQKLLAIDLRLQANPENKEAQLSRAITEWSDSAAPQLAVLASWLNGKNEFQRHLDAIPLERAAESRELFLAHLDARAALGRWSEVKELLESSRFPLDPVIQQMYLARCNAQLGAEAAAENSWRRALEEAGADITKLLMLATYAEKNRVFDIAALAYTAASEAAPRMRDPWLGRLRIARAQRNTQQIHSLTSAILEIWPDDTAVENSWAYTRLLLLPSEGSHSAEIGSIEQKAATLARIEPKNFAHRSLLALARLKLGRPDAALDAYKGFNLPLIGVRPLNPDVASALAVHSAVCAALGRTEDARREAELLQPGDLLPEEENLISDAADSPIGP